MIDCALYDVMCQTNIDWLLPMIIEEKQNPRKGNNHPISSPTGRFRTKDKKYTFLTQQTQKYWNRLTKIMGGEDLNDLPLEERRDKRTHEVNAALEKWTKTKDRDEALLILREANLPYAPVQTILEVLSDKNLIAQETFVEMEDDMGNIDRI